MINPRLTSVDFIHIVGGLQMNITLILIAIAAVLFELFVAPLIVNNMRNRRNIRRNHLDTGNQIKNRKSR